MNPKKPEVGVLGEGLSYIYNVRVYKNLSLSLSVSLSLSLSLSLSTYIHISSLGPRRSKYPIDGVFLSPTLKSAWFFVPETEKIFRYLGSHTFTNFNHLQPYILIPARM